MSIGKKILELRRKLHLSQEQMAKELHVSRQTISKWESNLSLPDMKTILLISELYHVSITELLEIDETQEETMTQLYDQINLVNKNLEKNNQKRTIVDIILIIICLACLCFTLLTFVKQDKEVIENNYYEGESFNDSWLYHSDIKVLSYELDKNLINVEVSCETNQNYKNSHIVYELKDIQGKQYSYQLKNTSSVNEYVYRGTIPLKNYTKATVSLVYNDEILTEPMSTSNYMNEILEKLIHVKVSQKKQEERQEFDLKKIVYELRDVDDMDMKDVDDLDIKGKLQGDMHIIIKDTDNEVCYLDQKIPINENREIELTQPLQYLEDVSISCCLTIDGVEYEMNKDAKIVEMFQSIELVDDNMTFSQKE